MSDFNSLTSGKCKGGRGMKEADIFKGTIEGPQIDQIYARNDEQCTNQTD